MVEIRSTTRKTFDQDDTPLDPDGWNTLDVGFTPESVIIRNDSDATLYYRDDADCDIHPILAGETYETSLETKTSFQLLPSGDDQQYRAWCRIN